MNKPSAFQLSTKTVVVIGIGAVLYGLLSYLTNFIPVAGNSLRPAIVVLTLLGAMFGPLVGFFAGMFGAMLNDLFTGQIWLHWNIGNGIIGLIAGFAYFLKGFDLNRGLIRSSHYIWIAIYGIAGNVVGLSAAAMFDIAIGTPEAAVYSWALVPAAVNSAWVVTLGLLLIAAIAKRKSSHSNLEIGK